jgi:hypothetical protein
VEPSPPKIRAERREEETGPKTPPGDDARRIEHHPLDDPDKREFADRDI